MHYLDTEATRLMLYREGYNDHEMGRAFGKDHNVYFQWRKRRELASKFEKNGVPMEAVLTPDECVRMKRALNVVARLKPEQVSEFLKAHKRMARAHGKDFDLEGMIRDVG